MPPGPKAVPRRQVEEALDCFHSHFFDLSCCRCQCEELVDACSEGKGALAVGRQTSVCGTRSLFRPQEITVPLGFLAPVCPYGPAIANLVSATATIWPQLPTLAKTETSFAREYAGLSEERFEP